MIRAGSRRLFEVLLQCSSCTWTQAPFPKGGEASSPRIQQAAIGAPLLSLFRVHGLYTKWRKKALPAAYSRSQFGVNYRRVNDGLETRQRTHRHASSRCARTGGQEKTLVLCLASVGACTLRSLDETAFSR